MSDASSPIASLIALLGLAALIAFPFIAFPNTPYLERARGGFPELCEIYVDRMHGCPRRYHSAWRCYARHGQMTCQTGNECVPW